MNDKSCWWYYFTRQDNSVKCNNCNWEGKYDSKQGTNGLKSHLEGKHNQLYLQKLMATQDHEKNKKQQKNTLKNYFSLSSPTSSTEPPQKSFIRGRSFGVA